MKNDLTWPYNLISEVFRNEDDFDVGSLFNIEDIESTCWYLIYQVVDKVRADCVVMRFKDYLPYKEIALRLQLKTEVVSQYVITSVNKLRFPYFKERLRVGLQHYIERAAKPDYRIPLLELEPTSSRVVLQCTRKGVNYLDEFADMSHADVMRLYGVGRSGRDHLTSIAENYGYECRWRKVQDIFDDDKTHKENITLKDLCVSKGAFKVLQRCGFCSSTSHKFTPNYILHDIVASNEILSDILYAIHGIDINAFGEFKRIGRYQESHGK